MTWSNAAIPEELKEAKLPRRDWILLPVISLLTIVLIAGSTEFVARRIVQVKGKPLSQCIIKNDPSTGIRAIPNSVCWEHPLEVPTEIEYRFNSCGYRADKECGPKAPGSYRIVLLGSSAEFGYSVPREKSFAALLPTELSQQTVHNVDLYNEAMIMKYPHSFAKYFNEVLAANPDMILWTLMSADIADESSTVPDYENDYKSGFWAKAKRHIKAAFTGVSFPDAVHNLWNQGLNKYRGTASGTLLRYLIWSQNALHEDRSQYVEHFLQGQGQQGFLQSQLSDESQSCLRNFDSDAADMEGRAKAAGIPFVVTLIPTRVQAAMISMGVWPVGYDPYKLGDELRAIVMRHGGIYIDILPYYRNTPYPEQGYFPFDGHPNADGNATIAKLLAKELTSGAVPALKDVSHQRTALEQGR